MSRNPSRDSQKGTFTIHSPVNPAQRISLAEIQEAASPLSASSPETLQEATLRYPLPLRRTPHGDRDRIGGVKAKSALPRSTLPNRHRLRGVQGGATPLCTQYSIGPQSRSTPLTIILRESMDRIRVIIRKGCGEWVPALPRNIPNNALCGAKTTCPSSWGGQGAPVSINPSPAQEDYKVMSITIIKR